jgi:hypothetical protein
MQWLLFNKLTFLHDCSNLDLHGPQLRPVHKELVATTKLGVQQPQLKKKKMMMIYFSCEIGKVISYLVHTNVVPN